MKNIPYVNLIKQHALLKEEILEAVGRILDKSNFILGDEVSEFENNIAQYCGVKYAVGVNSGTDALFLSLKVFGIGPGDEVITAPNSFLASASVVMAAGAKPVFVDIREDLNINPALIEEKITTCTKAIIPVHLTGKPADMDPIIGLAKKYNLKIIEDAAQAIGAEYHNKRVGSFGDAGCFSLHPLKTLNACGDAGVITTNDGNLYHLLLQMRNIGLKNRDESDIWGYNSRLDTMQAAILNVKLKYLDEWTEARRKNAGYYMSRLKKVCDTPVEEKNEKSVFHTFVVGVDRRKELIDYLEKNGIGSRIHYPIPIHLQKAAGHLGYKKGDFPVCEKKAERILSLPVYQGLTGDDLEYIVEKITGFYHAQ